MLFFVVLFFIAVTKCEGCEWNYNSTSSEGPDNWGTMCGGEYPACDMMEQSPINLNTSGIADKSGSFDTSVINFAFVPGEIHNNGHTCEFTPEYPTAKIIYDDVVYDWTQFHHHHPSEHTIDGEHMKVEIHFVHQNSDGNVSAISVLFDDLDDTVTTDNEFLMQIEEILPAHEGDPVAEVEIDFRILLGGATDDLEFYNYMGSFTTPPCTQRVNWFVYTVVQEATLDQLNKFNLFNYTDDLVNGNNRPVQDLNDRIVKLIDGVSFGGDDYDERVSVLEEKVDTITTDLATEVATRVLLAAYVDELKMEVDVVNQTIFSNVEYIMESLNEMNTMFDDEITTIYTNMSTLAEDVSNVYNGLKSEIDGLNATILENMGADDALEIRVTTLEDYDDDLDAADAALDVRVTALEDDAAINVMNVSTLDGKVTALDARVTTLEDYDDDLDAADAALDVRVTALEDASFVNVTTLDLKVTSFDSRVGALEAGSVSVGATLVGLGASVTGATARISDLEDEDVEMDDRLSTLETYMDAVREMYITPSCFGTSATASSVCSGNGVCVKKVGLPDGKCYCSNGYGGPKCDEVAKTVKDEAKAASDKIDVDENGASGAAVAAVVIACLGLAGVLFFCCVILVIVVVAAVALISLAAKNKSNLGKLKDRFKKKDGAESEEDEKVGEEDDVTSPEEDGGVELGDVDLEGEDTD